ncbi:P-type conjugative transfer protein TrbG [Chelativorans sp. M5D2P16]|uniref:P-type conjugative transfer protein TrbG n=1 Tax=Chelativorans sp. M5D2P16 TaxID=3095678 RepID=UPI002ACAEFCF|nr:P-type conjugative transfer protein TrbG [Chelativorans sp. M5D2P16]MDZ5698649.1 P-type conjugative transfer protein TrbG [Chelativorans sp. M5D2P16]
MKNRLLSFRAVLIVSASAVVFSACASKKVPPPEISYDAADFKPAATEKAPEKPVKIVEVPKPLPLPGQLQPEPSKAVEDKRSPEERVADANKAATQEPTKHGYVNAVQVYPYADGALYQLYAAPERVTDIALQPGETLTSVSAGDTVRWVIGDTVSGTGENQRTHVLVKPFAPGLKTNLVITTDRRSYHLQLESTEKTAMAAISWTYSEDQIIALRRRNARAEAAAPVASNVALNDIRFRYSITGDTPPWRPVRAFDDGHKVYIEFPRRIDQGEAPPLFVVGAKGGNELVNYRMRGNYYIVDRLFAAAELRLGTKPQQVVRITRTDGRPRRRTSLFGRLSR